MTEEKWTQERIAQFAVDWLCVLSASAVARMLNDEEGQRDAKGRKWTYERVNALVEAYPEVKPTVMRSTGRSILANAEFRADDGEDHWHVPFSPGKKG